MGEPLVPRVAVLVCDSWGVGDAPDAEAYGDAGSDTLANTARAVGGLRIPNLEALGIGEGAVKMRQLRALERLRGVLGDEHEEHER